jgi:hypothetical protein
MDVHGRREMAAMARDGGNSVIIASDVSENPPNFNQVVRLKVPGPARFE